MRAVFATIALAALAAAEAMPSAVSSAVAPAQSPPPGCSPNYDGTFVISPTNLTNSKRDLSQRNTQLGITLKNGILTDPMGRTGYVAKNEQFQFDKPPQAGAIWTAGFTICQNGSLALGNSVVWYRCLSGSFYNLYFKSIGGQCIPSLLSASPLNGTGPESVPASYSTENFATLGAHNGTAAASNGTASMTASGTATTGIVAGHHTTAKPGSSGMSSASASGSSAAASATSKAVAAGPVALGGEMFGLAAGLLAAAVL